MITSNCINCKKEIRWKPSQTAGKYCSNKCQREYQRNLLIENWKNGIDCGYKKGIRLKRPIREYMLEKVGFKCEECGWDKKNPITGRAPLEIDHIDGNSINCKEENLKVLCPNCHSLTPTWKALNKGNANQERLQYSKLK